MLQEWKRIPEFFFGFFYMDLTKAWFIAPDQWFGKGIYGGDKCVSKLYCTYYSYEPLQLQLSFFSLYVHFTQQPKLDKELMSQSIFNFQNLHVSIHFYSKQLLKWVLIHTFYTYLILNICEYLVFLMTDDSDDSGDFDDSDASDGSDDWNLMTLPTLTTEQLSTGVNSFILPLFHFHSCLYQMP